ncbi:hypothetical protein [Streptomyces sp. NPDC019224]|uniref:hypothetical protein n=1 Tax=Streptomyces sp. NPDC019224 TaxID=3154484 RepID=UPI0033C85BC0
MRRKVSISVAVAAAACITAGCGSGTGGGTNSTERPKGETVAISDSKLRDLTVPEEREIEKAEQILVKACMENRGFKYWVEPVTSADARRVGRYANDDVAWAKKYGYGRPFDEAAEKARGESPNVRYPNSLPQQDRIRYSLALDGDYDDVVRVELPAGGTVETPRKGCWAETRTRLYGDAEKWFKAKKTVTSLTPIYVPEILAADRLKKAVAAWSSCMEEAGRPFSSPEELGAKRDAATAHMNSREAREFDIALAVTDAGCSSRTSLGRIARDMETQYRSKLLKKYATENSAYQRMRLTALARARDLKNR